MRPRSENVVFHAGTITRADRERLLGQRGTVVWLTGLSGSGKSTIARAVERALTERGHLVQVLDGDNVRHGLCGDLGFSDADRSENIRRVAEVCGLFADAGAIVLAAFISPFRADRERARQVAGREHFVEAFVDAPLDVCEQRDPKGLYAKVRAGEIGQFTGVGSDYEAPEHPDLVLPSAAADLAECVRTVIAHLESTGRLTPPPAPAES